MASTSVQFHALPEEMVPFVTEIVDEFRLHVVVLRFFPFRANVEEKGDAVKLILEPDARLHFAFTLETPRLPAKTQMDFGDKNPCSLYLQIEHPSEDGLAQSYMTAVTDDKNALATWRKIARRLRRMTIAGVTVINLNTGETGIEKSFRYTEGAKKAEAEGMPMLSVPGVPNLRLGAKTGGASPIKE